MGGECNTHGRDEKSIWVKNHSEDLGAEVKIILEWILRKLGGKM
jgi:hypothetical protein